MLYVAPFSSMGSALAATASAGKKLTPLVSSSRRERSTGGSGEKGFGAGHMAWTPLSAVLWSGGLCFSGGRRRFAERLPHADVLERPTLPGGCPFPRFRAA